MVAVSKHQYQHDRVMRLKASRSSGGKHRTITTSRTKGRLALVAVAAGTVSSAGVGGATAATLQAPAEVEAPVSPEAATVEVDLATNDTALSSSGTQAAPQILAISEFKPVANIDEQLDKAIQYNAERAQNERAARAPSAVKPAEGTFTSGSACAGEPSTRVSTSPTSWVPRSSRRWAALSSTPARPPVSGSGSASSTMMARLPSTVIWRLST